MAGLLLAAEDRAHFLALMRRQTNSAVRRRTNALLLLDDGWTAERAGEALFIDADTVRAQAALPGVGPGSGAWTMPGTRRC